MASNAAAAVTVLIRALMPLDLLPGFNLPPRVSVPDVWANTTPPDLNKVVLTDCQVPRARAEDG
jgi:hypothetical protein